jgi:hypothetical protein
MLVPLPLPLIFLLQATIADSGMTSIGFCIKLHQPVLYYCSLRQRAGYPAHDKD